jgi:type VI protein secretion system component VasK
MKQQTAEPAPLKSAAARLFDLRVMIGALFTFYGVVLIIAGIFATAAEIQKAAGININLWMGIGMLVLGLLFLLWWRLQPAQRAAEAEPAVEPATQDTIGTVPGKNTIKRERKE